MKALLSIVTIYCISIFCAKAQANFPITWQSDMQLLMYTVQYNIDPYDTVYIGEKSFLVTTIPGHRDYKEFKISDSDLNRILFTLHKFDITGI
jgi:hypothetical protein